jgi:hydroxyacylglutathione hydrolase
MLIWHLTTGPLQVNTYIVADEAARQTAVIDPGGNVPEILRLIEAEDVDVRRIINTHAHFDHVGGVEALKRATGAPFGLHRAYLPLLDSYAEQLARFGIASGEQPTVDDYLEPGQTIELGETTLHIVFTPGHSPGHVTFVYRGGDDGSDDPPVAFAGDVLFRGSIGRTQDIPGGDFDRLMRSIREELLPLGDDAVVYPGHGPATTIGDERRHNPFLQ